MARAPYQVCDRDRRFIVAYLERKLTTAGLFWLSDVHEARLQWRRAKEDTVTIQQWCDDWLNDEQWQQLKAAVRAARRRYYRQGDPPVNVTLSRLAWQVLSDLARQDGLTLSEWLIQQHYPRWVREAPELLDTE